MKRTAITDADRRTIRRRRDETGETQAETAAWFAAQPEGKTLNQSQISKIMSSYISTMIIEKVVS
jgi:Fission yeast centromere protein N-terminal domain